MLAIALGLGLGFGGTLKESFAIPGTESQEALDRLDQVFPEVAGASASVVVVAPGGVDVHDADARAEIEAVAEHIDGFDGVEQALSPYSEYATDSLSEDGRAAIISVQFSTTADALPEGLLEQVRSEGESLTADGFDVSFGGEVYQELEYGLTVTEVFGVVFAAVVLVVTFGSVLAAGMPLGTAIIAIGVSMGGILFVAKFITVSSATPLLAVMIGIAVGIDYALFVLSRHRHQLANGVDPEESASTAVGTAGSAVLFAGVTVMIALAGLLIVGIPFLSVMGIAAAVAVFVAMAAAVTLLPAFLGLAKGRLVPKPGSRAAKRETGADERPSMGRRWVRFVLRAPIVFVVLVAGVLGTLAIPALSLQLALPSGAAQNPGTDARDAYDAISEHFGAGSNGPLLVMIDLTRADDDTLLDDLAAVRDEVRSVPGVKTTGDALPNPTVDSAILQVVPETGPTDPATLDVVNGIRGLEGTLLDETGMQISVTGYTAVAIDISDRLDQALLPFAGVVVGLSFLLLMMVFRSVLVPLKAALSFLLSVFAAFGVVVAIFQWGWFADALHIVPGPIISFMPILLLAIIFGLAMDYEVFLVSGMREAYVRGAPPKQAIEFGFAQGARVVTAAALIMFFVFAAFVPEGAGVIKAIALGLAAGIAFDAFLVRMTLVPALMALMGKAAWWLPRWLAKRLPDLDIEGEHLRTYRSGVEWAQGSSERAALALDELVVGDEQHRIGPVSGEISRGGVLFLVGPEPARRVVAATIQARLAPVSGRLQVLGHTVPGDESSVRGLVAIADLSDLEDRDFELSLGDLVREHERAARSMWSLPASDAAVRARVARIRAAVTTAGGAADRVTTTTAVGTLDPVARAVVLAGLALAEGPDLLVVDANHLAELPASGELVGRIARAIAELAPDATTIVVGVPPGLDLAAVDAAMAGPRRTLAALTIGDPITSSTTERKDALR
nr:MMPL family transporter [Pseudoclavibacter chungangensis]